MRHSRTQRQLSIFIIAYFSPIAYFSACCYGFLASAFYLKENILITHFALSGCNSAHRIAIFVLGKITGAAKAPKETSPAPTGLSYSVYPFLTTSCSSFVPFILWSVELPQNSAGPPHQKVATLPIGLRSILGTLLKLLRPKTMRRN